MAYILTPCFAPAYQAAQCNPFGFCAPVSRPTYANRNVQRPQLRPSPFASLFKQFDELLSEIDYEAQHQTQIEARAKAQRDAHQQRQAQIEAHIEAQREAHRQRQLRKRALRAKFAITQNEQGWQVNAEIPGFEQENISIEVTDESTIQIAGSTKWRSEASASAQPEVATTPAVEQSTEEATPKEKVDSLTLNKPEFEAAIPTESTTETGSAHPATSDTDTASHKSYQATVEDDFEDLGAEASSLFSTRFQPATPAEPKDEEKIVEHWETINEPVEDPEISVPAITEKPLAYAQERQQQKDELPHWSFERTFRFPERIDTSNIWASLKNGILSIAVPRAQPQKTKRIVIM